MADIDRIMDELLASAPEEEQEQDTDIYYGPQHDNDSQALGERERDEDDYDEDDTWEYQEEYDEWENEMDSIGNSYCDRARDAYESLDEIISFIDNSEHRYWPEEQNRIEDLIDRLNSLVSDLYRETEDYRSNPEDW